MSEEQARILVIDDDSTDFIFIKRAFENLPINVELFHCERGDMAVETVSSKACRVVFLDLSLNGESGLDVLKALRNDETTALLPVIIFSSSGSRRDIEACYAAGANAYVEKPLTMDSYRNFAKSFCDFWLNSARIP